MRSLRAVSARSGERARLAVRIPAHRRLCPVTSPPTRAVRAIRPVGSFPASGGGTLRYRFEVAVPADAPAGECRFAVMVEGAEPSIARSKGLDVPVTGRIGVIVYLTVGDGAPDLEIFAPKVTTLNGQQVPVLSVHNSGTAHGRMTGFLTGKDAKGISYDFTPSDFPILPHEQRDVFLTPSTPATKRCCGTHQGCWRGPSKTRVM